MNISTIDAARRIMNAAKRMRRQAVRGARIELAQHVDATCAEEERLVQLAVEELLRSHDEVTGVRVAQA